MRKLMMVALLALGSFVSNATPKEVVCIGDSITEGYGIPEAQRKEYRYSKVLGDLLGKKYKVINLGHSARTMLTNVNLAWGQCGFPELEKTNPYIAIIMLGTNDSKMENWKGNAKQFEKDTKDLINRIRKQNKRAKIFLCLPPPSFSGKTLKLSEGDGISGARIKAEVIPILKRVAAKKRVKLIDVFTAMRKHPELLDDGVHPNIKGANFLAKFLYKQIKPALK